MTPAQEAYTIRIAKQLDNIASVNPKEAFMIASAHAHMLALIVGRMAPDRAELREAIDLFTEGFARTATAAFEVEP